MLVKLADAQASAAAHRQRVRSRAFRSWTRSVSAEPFETAGRLAAHGVVGLSGLLAVEEVGALSAFIDSELALRKTQATSRDDAPEEPKAVAAFERYFSEVRERTHRFDLKLSIKEPAVRGVLQKICTAVGPLMEQVATLDARIVELASLISDPTAKAQQYHSDTLLPSTCGAPVYTCFVALQDIDPAMGPTWVIPGTHTEANHRELRDQGPEGSCKRRAAERAAVQMSCKSGDAFVMDSRLWHHGGGNRSALRRRLFYVTFGVPHCHPDGSTYSILEEMAGQLRLRDWVC